MKIISFPKSLDLRTSLAFGELINNLEGDTDYLFDFGNLRYIGPTGLVYISSCIEDLCNRCPNNEPAGDNFFHLTYAAHMGFFKIFDLDWGNDPGEANGSSRYIPITLLNALEIKREAAMGGGPIGPIVEERSQQIAAVLTQQIEGDLHDTVSYAIREVLRNAVEHSQSHTVRYCAQLYPSQHRVEVVILDKGRGILKSFSQNPYVSPSSDREAINFALMPGISGTAFKGSKINSRDKVWKNSGYGLYMTSRICRAGGDFFIGSMKSGIQLKDSKKVDLPFGHQGTMLRLSIDLKQVTNLQSRLLKFSEDGQKVANTHMGTIVEPSTASHMLTVDYQDS